MSLVRNLASDLVEKKLWPVAAALLAAIVAVPLLLAGGGSTPSPAPAPVAAAPATATPAAVRVTLDDSQPSGPRNRAGAVRNPFRQQHQPNTETASAATATGSTATGGGGTSTATGAGAASPASTTTTPGNDSFDAKTGLVKQTETARTPVAKTTTATAKHGYIYRVAWRFGREGALKSNHDAARLTALPSAKNPVLQFFGLLEDRRTVTFLVRSGATVEGEGWCHPSPADCRTLDLRPGDVAALAYDGARYRIGISKVQRSKVSAAAARRSHQRVAKSGVAVLEAAAENKAPALTELAFDTVGGLLQVNAG